MRQNFIRRFHRFTQKSLRPTASHPMNERKPESPMTASLRERAEKLFRETLDESKERLDGLSPETLRAALHELRVHQIELEMQNEEMLRSQADLEASRSRYFDLYDLAPVGYCTLSEQGLILEANLTAATLLGKARGTLVTMRFPAFIPKEEQDVYYLHRKLLIETGEPQAFDLRMVTRDGGEFFAHLKILAAKGKNGEPECRVVIIDVTIQKQAEEELRDLNLRLENKKTLAEELAIKAEAATLAKSEFLAIMSHELRTPLNGVLGFAELLSDTPLNDEQKLFVRTIASSGTHLLDVVNDVLNFSSIEKGVMEIRPERFATAALLESSVIGVRKAAGDKGLEFRCETAPGVPDQIIGDERRIRQVLINLLANAVKFTDCGSVVFRVAPASAGGRAFLDFSVTDTGIGISPETVGHLFQPFVQADTTMHRRFGGTGLGLAISRRLAEAMGGSLEVDTTPGKGSAFSFRLPLEPASPPMGSGIPAVCPDGRTPLPRPGSLVLVVEDNPDSRTLASVMLRNLGCRAECSVDGAEALKTYAPGKFAAILMDVAMPVMNGFEATEKIREIETAGGVSRVPIIAMTANVMPGDRERCLASGMDEFLPKPFKLRDLTEKLARFLKA